MGQWQPGQGVHSHERSPWVASITVENSMDTGYCIQLCMCAYFASSDHDTSFFMCALSPAAGAGHITLKFANL
jgi:hypothetical protein